MIMQILKYMIKSALSLSSKDSKSKKVSRSLYVNDLRP